MININAGINKKIFKSILNSFYSFKPNAEMTDIKNYSTTIDFFNSHLRKQTAKPIITFLFYYHIENTEDADLKRLGEMDKKEHLNSLLNEKPEALLN